MGESGKNPIFIKELPGLDYFLLMRTKKGLFIVDLITNRIYSIF
jgi:hypothetical protein